ncbi:acyl-CoA dehydrogenase [Sphingomonas bacterium]|uniref:acyl-CoA dehydrogenase n=1 Tax=Sphingomonas bacterium TaxID=1895847 RepID=UPI001576FF9A|nr:acyl-CoA dehydrogenase [Sphingomonas bacterium]
MSDVLIQPRDLSFLLWEWLRLDELLARPEYEGHDRETVDAVLNLSTSLARDSFLPHFKEADHHEPSLDGDGEVHILPAAVDALRQYAEVGLFAAGFAPALGGLGLPSVVTSASLAQFTAANPATAAYIMLTIANARLIATFGTPAQADAFARPEIEGRQLGTMCLSEPQAGSGLGDIRTRAQPDGEDVLGPRYRLSGTKMWISGGDQDATRNIVHLVLAKIPEPDGSLPEGTRGISLFIVPKWLGTAEGHGGERNDVTVAGLNHKMGYRGTANCLLNFGEGRHRPGGEPGAVGYLLGQAGQGLALMFQMMNEARVAVGLGGAAIAYRGYRHALRYAQERTQGRALDAPRGTSAPLPIIEHPDVQRMLLAQKAYAEGALALTLYCAKLVDEESFDRDASELLALMTPVAKTWPSEWGLVANQLAIQVHGGYGYTRDFDVEQLYRDNRLNPIHEGTTGIQALDLLGRKILRSNGAGLAVLEARVRRTIEGAAASSRLSGFADQLSAAWRRLEDTLVAVRAADPSRVLANATSFLQAFGHITVAWLWLDQATVCVAALGERTGITAFHEGKLRACRFFYECELPGVYPLLGFVDALSDVAANVPVEQF